MAGIAHSGVPQECLCSKCLQVIPAEVFQCINGHILCDMCKTFFGFQCPECNHGDFVRNIPLESLLSTLSFNCKYKHEGCRAQLNRCEIALHQSHCCFGIKFAVCKLFGLNCEFTMTSAKHMELLSHMISTHNAQHVENFGCINIILSVSNVPVSYKNNRTNYNHYFWEPMLIDTADSTAKVILLLETFANSEELLLGVQLLLVPLENQEINKKIKVDFVIQQKRNNLPETIRWRQTALDIRSFSNWSFQNQIRISFNHECAFDPNKVMEIECHLFGDVAVAIENVHKCISVQLQNQAPFLNTGNLQDTGPSTYLEGLLLECSEKSKTVEPQISGDCVPQESTTGRKRLPSSQFSIGSLRSVSSIDENEHDNTPKDPDVQSTALLNSVSDCEGADGDVSTASRGLSISLQELDSLRRTLPEAPPTTNYEMLPQNH